MQSRTSLQQLAAVLACLTVSAAQAAPLPPLQWTWASDLGGAILKGTFTTDPTADPNGFYLITSVTGELDVGGATIPTVTNLLPVNTIGANDNLVSATAPFLTGNGFSFDDDFFQYNFYNDGGTTYRYCASVFGCNTLNANDPVVTFSAQIVSAPVPVPEPATSGLMAVGLVLMAGATRRRLAADRG